jgi:hypothetical protein
MPNFQQTVRQAQTTGFQGEIIEAGPTRAFPKTLLSVSAANNIFGRVFTIIDGSDTEAEAGGEGVFAGILSSPKQNVASGLAPTPSLRNNEIGQILDMGIIIVPLSSAANIGDVLYFDPNTANATAGKMSAILDATYTTEVPNAKVVRHNTTGAGLAFIQLTN